MRIGHLAFSAIFRQQSISGLWAQCLKQSILHRQDDCGMFWACTEGSFIPPEDIPQHFSWNGTLIWSLLTHWAPFLGFGRHPSSPVVLLRHTTAYGDAGEVDMVLWYKHKPCGQDSVSLRTLIPIPVIHVWHRNLLTGIPGWHFCQHWLKQVRKERVVCCGEELELQDNSKWY